MASNDFENGVWRTVGGRRIFIRDGESLSSAMKKSGKFKSGKKKQEEHYAGEELYNDDPNRFGNKLKEYNDKMSKEQEESAKRVNERYEKELKEKYMNIPEEERVKAYEEGKNWKDLVKEKEEKLTKSGERDKRTITKEEMEKSFREDVKKDPEFKAQIDKMRESQKLQRQYEREGMSSREAYEKAQEEVSKEKSDYKLSKYEKEMIKATNEKDDQMRKEAYSKVENQIKGIEGATGSKVSDAFETDLYGNGKETRFMIDDNKWISHTTESFGQKEDTWKVNELKNGNIESKSYKSYDDMIKNIGGSKESGSRLSKYSKAYEEYKKQHPNTKITLNQFVKYSESIRG